MVSESTMPRRLVAILAADVAGYSTLMESDEVDAFERLKAHREELIEPQIESHHGRVFKLMGDGLLAEFGSVVDAVKAAVAVQREMSRRNADLTDDQRIELRIGINLGDVIIDGKDFHGDGVNVAARLQQLADPGGISISGSAYEQLQGKIDLPFEFIGEKKVKNIKRPIRVYRIKESDGAPPIRSRPQSSALGLGRFVRTALIVLAVAIGGGAYWYYLQGSSTSPIDVASEENMALPLPDRPSIAVLPFANMSTDANQQFFADGMTDSLITDLSKVSQLFVIARNSTFVYQGKPVKISQVAEELGVRYVLEGSVQRAGDRVRVNAQLIDALNGGHIWADRYDGDVADIFAAQDAFVSKIVDALEVRLTTSEKLQIASGKTTSLDAKESFDEGWSLFLRFNAKDTVASIPPLKRAIEIDPEFGRAYAALAMVHFRIKYSLWFEEVGLPAVTNLALARHYVELAKKYPTSLSYTVEALAAVYSGKAEAARRNAGRAIALDPNDPEAHIAMAWALIISGEPGEALNFVATAIRLNPNYPSQYVLAHGTALFAMGNLEQAAEVFAEGVNRSPDVNMLLVPMSSVLAQLGQRDEARAMLLKFRPDSGTSGLANFADSYAFPALWDYKHADIRERLFDGLRVAALPLDVTVASLEKDLRDGIPFAQIFATRRLGWFGPAAAPAVPALIEALQDDRTRREAIVALGKIGAPASSAVPALLALEKEVLVGNDVRDALSKIRGN